MNPGYVETDSVAMYLQTEENRKAFFEEIEGTTPLRALGELARHPRRADRAQVRAVGGLLALPSWLTGTARLRRETLRTSARQNPAGNA